MTARLQADHTPAPTRLTSSSSSSNLMPTCSVTLTRAPVTHNVCILKGQQHTDTCVTCPSTASMQSHAHTRATRHVTCGPHPTPLLDVAHVTYLCPCPSLLLTATTPASRRSLCSDTADLQLRLQLQLLMLQGTAGARADAHGYSRRHPPCGSRINTLSPRAICGLHTAGPHAATHGCY